MSIYDLFVLVDTKARMNLKSEVSKLYLSFLWWIIEPILFVGAFYFVFSVLLDSGQKDYLVFLMCAKIPFMWFSKSVTSASGAIVENHGIIGQIDINKIIFPLSSIQTSLYKELPVFLLLVGVCVFYGYSPSITWLWLLPLIFLQYLVIVVFGLVAALLVSYMDDVRMFINMGMLFLMFSSGIFFDISDIRQPFQEYLLYCNPIAFLCDAYRKILMSKGGYSVTHLLALCCIFTILLSSNLYLYRQLSRNIASRVLVG